MYCEIFLQKMVEMKPSLDRIIIKIINWQFQDSDLLHGPTDNEVAYFDF